MNVVQNIYTFHINLKIYWHQLRSGWNIHNQPTSIKGIKLIKQRYTPGLIGVEWKDSASLLEYNDVIGNVLFRISKQYSISLKEFILKQISEYQSKYTKLQIISHFDEIIRIIITNLNNLKTNNITPFNIKLSKVEIRKQYNFLEDIKFKLNEQSNEIKYGKFLSYDFDFYMYRILYNGDVKLVSFCEKILNESTTTTTLTNTTTNTKANTTINTKTNTKSDTLFSPPNKKTVISNSLDYINIITDIIQTENYLENDTPCNKTIPQTQNYHLKYYVL